MTALRKYNIQKVLNNNVLICTFKDQEVVLIGKGIGFNKKRGMVLSDTTLIEKVYTLKTERDKAHYKALVEITEDYIIHAIIDAVNIVKDYCDASKMNALMLSLTDHLIFAIKRIKEGQIIYNPFQNEIKQLYPDDYQIADKFIKQLSESLYLRFPDDEIGFIALHIASNKQSESLKELSQTNELILLCVQIIESDFKIEVDKLGIPYHRFIRHINFLIKRLRHGDIVKKQCEFENVLQTHYPRCYNIAVKIMKMMQQQLNVDIYEAEVMYLTLHIHNLTQQ
ncbi:PRD domain-containing protein [Staphylococcus massiliensis]|uniref:PRD domain-containing protein n=1 Tax=Staphylococcus massiliensis TaxID=555791 RepID=UPI003BAE509E